MKKELIKKIITIEVVGKENGEQDVYFSYEKGIFHQMEVLGILDFCKAIIYEQLEPNQYP